MPREPVCLHFLSPEGTDLYLMPGICLRRAIKRKDRKSILHWEDSDIIPLRYTIFIKLGSAFAERFYTQKTLFKLNRWFARNKRHAGYKYDALLTPTRIERIHLLFREEYEKFNQASFVGKIMLRNVPKYGMSRRTESEMSDKKIISLEDKKIFIPTQDDRLLDDWSV